MELRIIRVSEVDDRKLWRLIVKRSWGGTCLNPSTYVFNAAQLRVIKNAGIYFEVVSSEAAQEPQAKRASGARQR